MGSCLSNQATTEHRVSKANVDISIKTSRTEFVKLTPRYLLHRKGEIRDDYTISSKLGKGTYGSVYLGIHNRTGIERAIKRLSKKNIENPEKMLEEVQILKDLDHPNIVKVFEVIETATDYYIVTELCKGQELFERIIENGRISEAEAAEYGWQILSAINHCHVAGIIHRDIKPENLIFESREPHARLKVIDFGVSKKISEGEMVGSFMGTIYYIAPEVVNANYDEKCDIWSAGVVIYAMLSGKLPFKGVNRDDTILKIMMKQLRFESSDWQNISKTCKNILERMLDRRPEARPSAIELLQHSWFLKTAYLRKCSHLDDTLKNLRRFQETSKLKSAILHFIISHMTNTKEIDEIVKVFQSIDKDGDGRVSLDELKQACQISGLNNPDDIEEIMRRCDMDSNGFMDFTEFCIAAYNWDTYISPVNIEKLFRMYDQDSSGTINIKEMSSFLGPVMTHDGVNLFDEVDTDRNGEIDGKEFMEFVMTKIIPRRRSLVD